MKTRIKLVTIISLLVMVLSACVAETPSPAPTPTHTASPAAPTVTTTASVLPTPNPLTADVTQWSSLSPDGQFVARGILSTPKDDSSNGATYANVSVGKPNGPILWTLVDGWLPVGLGAYTPQPLQWSSDSRIFYYTNRQSVEGCKPLPTNGSDLWSVDITSGKIQQLQPMQAYFLALSPDETRLAYIEQVSLDLVFKNLQNGKVEKRLSLDPDLPFDAGDLFWSPDGSMLVLTVAYNPCPLYSIDKPPYTDTTTIRIVDTRTFDIRTIIGRDAERKVSTGWLDNNTVELTDPNGKTYLYELSSQTTSAYRTPVPTGIFPMVTFYEPLVLKYDPSLWIDRTNYNDPIDSGYGLQSTRLRSCRIGVQGPTDINDPNAYTSTKVNLGTIHFNLIRFKQPAGNGMDTAWYWVEDQSIPGFSFASGTPILVMQASADEWTQCKKLVEDVFATLSMGTGSSLEVTSPPAALQTTIEEISGPLAVEPLRFTVVQGGQIFTSRTTLYKDPPFPDRSTRGNGSYCIQTELHNHLLIACQHYTQDGSESWVSVTQDEKVIYSISTGNGYVNDPLQGLWAYGGHWALEIVHATTRIQDNMRTAHLVGQVTVDGVLLNDKLGYEESFGLQTIAGYPFYFFNRDGRIGYSYNGMETMLDFDTILHYGCCSAGAFNPNSTPNHVDFFAKKGNIEYFVNIGVPLK
ncbi:MAG: hypothetical protein ABFD24_07700 [Anaerolineaceae bacterium]